MLNVVCGGFRDYLLWFLVVCGISMDRSILRLVQNKIGSKHQNESIDYLGWGRDSYFFCDRLLVIMWFLFGGRGFRLLLVHGIRCVILLWHSLFLLYNYSTSNKFAMTRNWLNQNPYSLWERAAHSVDHMFSLGFEYL